MTLRKLDEAISKPCLRCGKSFPRYGNYQKLCEECKIKTGPDLSKNKFVCLICPEKFRYHSNFIKHLKTHCVVNYLPDKKKSFVKGEKLIVQEMKL